MTKRFQFHRSRFYRLFGVAVAAAVLMQGEGPAPPYPASKVIAGATWEKRRFHKADGDTWPMTWAADGNLYGSAGDNQGSPMNFWRIEGNPITSDVWPDVSVWLVDNMPVDPKVFCQRPHVDAKNGVKPSGMLSVGGTLYFGVELMNYGEDQKFNRQRNITGWILTSTNYGKTWKRDATPVDFFTGRLAGPMFVQFGRDYEGARDGYVYAHFAGAEDGNSYWENGDFLLLGRVPKGRILERGAWEFWTGLDGDGQPAWSKRDADARPVFRFFHMTGENHVSYNPGLKRYVMGNYGFLDEQGNPRPYHQKWPDSVWRSQLTLYEAPEPWGPWSLFFRDDNWGQYGVYNPQFPSKWMSPDGRIMWMVSSGTYDDYNFTFQKLTLTYSR